MAKVYSLHLIAPKAGANGPDFERFFHEAVERVCEPNGMTVRLLKGERGERKGGYLLMFEFECGEGQDQPIPEAGATAWKISDEVVQWMGAASAALAQWNEYATPIDTIYAGYREV